MRLGYDLSILRHPRAGTARYAEELLAAMTAQRPDETIVTQRGWRRLRRGHRVLRLANLASDVMWTAVVAPSLGWRSRLDVFYSPWNIVPPVTHCPSEDCLEGRAAYAFAAISIWRRISPGGVSAVRPSRPGPV